MPSRFISSQVALDGHPDRVCDIIADAILDEYLLQDKASSVDIGVMLTPKKVIIGGEISSSADIDINHVTRSVLKEIGYTDYSLGLDGYTVDVDVYLERQSQDISRGIFLKGQKTQGAGDSATVYGYAVRDGANFMPETLNIAWKIAIRLREVRRAGIIEGLGLDGKVLVVGEYNDENILIRIDSILLSVQHIPSVDENWLKMELMENVINKVASEYIDENTKVLVNTAGRFVIGGPMADIGISGNKMEMYTYGGEVRTGDNTFSGKDPYKIDRTGSLMARKIAKYVVEQGMADKCQIGVSYSIGLADPVLITVDTFGTLHWDEEGILKIVQEQFSLSPMDIISELKLLKPIYKDLSLNGHFGRPDSNWEIVESDVISL